MLVLTRKQNEKIRIGDSITITVLRMKGKAVRLGIEAPHDINVIRGELCFDLEEQTTSGNSEPQVEQCETPVPPKSKPLVGDKSSAGERAFTDEATSHWPLESQERDNSPTAQCTVPLGISPLRSMIEART